ncbi:nitrite reductase [Agrilactobacillus composti DSM 18527 = JCM 14202]|nr:Rieske 2Fe-2S domain-containing protein [Agrilactobacillus composti]GAF39669.1 nitrite reductase [Agrilactobacillus composti DSM 18527 = JCM 14202]
MTRKAYIAEMADIPLKMGLEVQNGAQSMAIFKLSDTEVYAIGNICPHRQGPLADGMVTGKAVICPLHSWQISLLNGEPLLENAGKAGVPTYETIIEAGKLYVMVD